MPETGFSLQLSASSLQDFADCPRRFQLRYVLGVHWPLPVAEPVAVWETRQQMAQDFHRLAQQYLLGIPHAALDSSIDEPDVRRWWQAFKDYAVELRDARVLPEIGLSISFLGHRLYARYDALAIYGVTEGDEKDASRPDKGRSRYVILDWKTYRRRPPRSWLANRQQTSVYPLVLVQSSQLFEPSTPAEPEDIELRYWLAEDPKRPESFAYSADQYVIDLERLTGLVTEINRLLCPARKLAPDGTWPLTVDLQSCRFCSYRSLCDRGGRAGDVEDDTGSGESDLGDETILEIGALSVNQVAETALWQG